MRKLPMVNARREVGLPAVEGDLRMRRLTDG